jgi:hypothetical protein
VHNRLSKRNIRDGAKRQVFLRILTFGGASTDHKRDLNGCKGPTDERTHGQRANESITKARGFQSTYLSASTTFYMCIIMYKKQGAPDQHTSLLLLLFTHASPRIKSKGFSISISSYFSYVFIITSKGHSYISIRRTYIIKTISIHFDISNSCFLDCSQSTKILH